MIRTAPSADFSQLRQVLNLNSPTFIVSWGANGEIRWTCSAPVDWLNASLALPSGSDERSPTSYRGTWNGVDRRFLQHGTEALCVGCCTNWIKLATACVKPDWLPDSTIICCAVTVACTRLRLSPDCCEIECRRFRLLKVQLKAYSKEIFRR